MDAQTTKHSNVIGFGFPLVLQMKTLHNLIPFRAGTEMLTSSKIKFLVIVCISIEIKLRIILFQHLFNYDSNLTCGLNLLFINTLVNSNKTILHPNETPLLLVG